MKWPIAAIGDTRVVKKFAWYPVRMTEIKDNYCIWGEYYYSYQRYGTWGGWYTMGKSQQVYRRFEWENFNVLGLEELTKN